MLPRRCSRRAFVGGLLGGGVGLVVGCASSSDGDRGADDSTAPPPTTGPSTSSSVQPATSTTSSAPTTVAPWTTITSLPDVPPAYFPAADWETVSPPDSGWDLAALDSAVEFAFSRATEALVVVDGGRIVVERYGAGGSGAQRDIASCQKSVVSLLMGIAGQRALVDLDAPVSTYLGAGWSNAAGADELRITVRHLLSMTSGLDGELRAVAAPGEVWSYNNDAYHQLQPVLETVAGAGIDALCREWLWTPIGATASAWYERPGNGPNSVDAKGRRTWGLVMSARDMARFGLLVQRNGGWAGDEILAAAPDGGDGEYLSAALHSSSAANPSYGYLWWLNGQPGYRIGPAGEPQPGPLVPTAPSDLVAALGKDDQKIYVSRSAGLVVTRQGGRAGSRSRESLSDFDAELWQLLVAARPA